MNSTTEKIFADLNQFATPEKAKKYQFFFKTGEGQYGEGDVFLGLSVPETRAVAKQYVEISLDEIEDLLQSPYHEVRLCGTIILVLKYQKARKNIIAQKEIVEFYLSHAFAFNNWDLVDLSCYKILGNWYLDKDPAMLFVLAQSSNLWEQRIAIISTIEFIKHNKFDVTLQLAEMLLFHKHDLMHKAVGWMLREIGKRNKQVEESFLLQYYTQMPRTTLRYAIEKFPEHERRTYLKGER